MKTFTLRRRYSSHGTYGELSREDGSHVAYTCEPAHMHLTHPCVPEGAYRVERYDSPKHGSNTWQLENVPHRTNIQIHVANWPSELLGCIAPGEMFGASPLGEWGVLRSRHAYNKFMDETKDLTEFKLIITRAHE